MDHLKHNNTGLANIDFARLIDTAGIGVIVHQWDTTVVYANPTALTMLNLSYEQLIGSVAVDPQWHLIDEHHKQLHVSEFPVNKVKSSESSLYGEVVGVLDFKHDDTKWFKVNAVIEKSSESGMAFIVVTLYALENIGSLFSFEQIVQSAGDIIIVTEADDIEEPSGPKIVYVNNAFERLTGYSAKEVIGDTPRLLQGKFTDKAARDRIKTSLEKKQAVRETLLNYTKSGQPYFIDMNIIPLKNRNGEVTHFAAIERDVTEQTFYAEQLEKRNRDLKQLKENLQDVVRQRTVDLIAANRKLQRLAYYDVLTDVPNRRYFLEMSNSFLSLTRRNGQSLAVAMIDVDDFKSINDQFGHAAGDASLHLLACCMKDFFRAEDIIGRLGGEEFGLTMLFDNPAKVVSTLQRFQQKLAERFEQERPSADSVTLQPFTVSIGVCVIDAEQTGELDTLLKCADNALYQVKHQGKNAVILYDGTQ
ncbi:diguanylate cyclase [Arsukibacterium sp.]|uniref:diguanylate cyclase n=1 Tax=Arsukibacterium sp. TaxID=1977258 RepID=UPI0035671766